MILVLTSELPSFPSSPWAFYMSVSASRQDHPEGSSIRGPRGVRSLLYSACGQHNTVRSDMSNEVQKGYQMTYCARAVWRGAWCLLESAHEMAFVCGILIAIVRLDALSRLAQCLVGSHLWSAGKLERFLCDAEHNRRESRATDQCGASFRRH